ncbi:MAG: hypothetical protein PF541_13360 [Prolixibacteraceae bacterium]|jgi:hypothetical protein|nr:hypothetical protein [Prolixibacteraceae bacterium]
MKRTIKIAIAFTVFAALTILNKNSYAQTEQVPIKIIFEGRFDTTYNSTEWIENWGIPWTARTDKNNLENSQPSGKALRVAYPKGGVGPGETGSQFPIVFKDLPNNTEGFYKEACLRYFVKFEEGFDFRLGGKLPGLMGGGDSWVRSGGNQPNGLNGWTLRFMWREGGKIVVYAYVPPSKNGKYGSETWGQDIDCDFTALPSIWHSIEQYINVGDPNTDNGKLKVWIDGELHLDLNDLCFGYSENSFGLIGGVYFSTFHGGNTAEWGPLTDSYAQFKDFVVTKKRLAYPTE